MSGEVQCPRFTTHDPHYWDHLEQPNGTVTDWCPGLAPTDVPFEVVMFGDEPNIVWSYSPTRGLGITTANLAQAFPDQPSWRIAGLFAALADLVLEAPRWPVVAPEVAS